MLKKSLKYISIAALACYLLFLFVIIPWQEDNSSCKELVITISGNELGTINNEEIVNELKNHNLYPEGVKMEEISCQDIENFINNMSLVKECQVYKTNNNSVMLKLSCRQPVLKVYDKFGNTYYIDCEGCKITGIKEPLLLPVVSGEIDDNMIWNELMTIASVIKKDPFWMAQIEQIYFNENKEAVIIPRMGEHIIELGTVKQLEEKLSSVKIFYTNGLSIMGWDKYNKLNIKISDKVICTKRDKEK
jgi:cell division protein FtsQ